MHRPRRVILGTAGHIDHGKSALVKALTGTDPDRLPEEKARGMTIVLGFARLELPAARDGEPPVQVSLVDVPGHERFVKTMVAGATGIDLGLLVVAADDGVMPQTREHVEILDLLGVGSGLITVSKVDSVPAERIREVRQQVTALVAPTLLRDWPIVPTSAKTGQGLDELRAQLSRLIAALPPRRATSIFRLAIDRVFTIHGRGTVVTGSVLCGTIAPGGTLELHPPGVTCKVREVQSHGEAVEDAAGGQRAALNLTGLDKAAVDRGMELATPGYLTRTRYVDARVRILARCGEAGQSSRAAGTGSFPSHHGVRVDMGTSEHMARLVVIGADEIPAGREGLAQIRFRDPVVASFGQRFILRSESAQTTLGGGLVVRPVSRRVAPHDPAALEALGRAESSDAYERLCEAVRGAGFEQHRPERLACEAGIEPAEVAGLLRRMEEQGLLVTVGGRRVHRGAVEASERRVMSYLRRHHEKSASEPGLPKDRLVGWIEARTTPGLGRAMFDHLVSRRLVTVSGPYVADAAFRPALSAEDAAQMAQLVKEILAAEFDPPDWAKLRTIQSLSKQRAKVLADLAKVEPGLVSFGLQRYISAAALERFKATVRELGRGGRKFTLAEVRDALGLSRRVVQPLLEHLDRAQFTKRVGDERVLVEKA